MQKYEVISADGHLEVPMESWIDWVPIQHRDFMPRLIRSDDGQERWRIEAHGEVWERNCSGNLVADWDYDEFVPGKSRYLDSEGAKRPGTGDAVQRLREQDIDGIEAEVLFPPVYSPLFFKHDLKRKDRDGYLSFIRGYNSFLADYCHIAPDRLIGVAMMPETGVDDAIAEMVRSRELGLRAMAPTMWPNGSIQFEPDDDRFFAAAIDVGMRVTPHMDFGGVKPSPPGGASKTVDNILAGIQTPGPAYTIGQLIVNGVFDRFPNLRVYFAETHAGWLPYTLMWVDEVYPRWNHFVGVEIKKMPSEYWRDNCLFGFVADRLAMKLWRYIGVHMLMFGSDFPHSVGTFPYTRETLDDLFEGVSPDIRRQVLVGNPCEFFGLDPDADLTPTP